MNSEKKSVAIVVETVYNLNTNKSPGINKGSANLFGVIWYNKVFKTVDDAFAKLNEYIEERFAEGAKHLSEDEVKEINTYFDKRVATANRDIKPQCFKLNDRAYMFSVRSVMIDD